MTTLRKLTRDDVEIEVIARLDDMVPVKGNAMASGDDEYDRQVEEEINTRLWAGDIWAWADVEVKVSWNGISGSDYLGGCSYADEEDFKRGGYYDDMIDSALADLNGQISLMFDKIKPLLPIYDQIEDLLED